MRRLLWLIVLVGLVGCGPKPAALQDTAELSWPQLEARARGRTVSLVMWTGDAQINRYMESFVRPRLAERHGIKLQIVPAQGNGIVAQLTTELEAKKKASAWDMMWINGETFYQLRQIDALYGPFTARLPNAQYIDFENPFIRYDFQQEVNGYECPWGNVQLALIYDSARVASPPKNPAELLAWCREHPGRFTFDSSFTGMTFLKCLLYDFAGGPKALAGKFDERKYTENAPKLWAYLRQLQPYLWREGKTFPQEVATLHQLLANGEIDFSMSNNDGEVDNKVAEGFLPPTCRAYVLDTGTIQNSHYMGIVKTSANAAAAMVVCNFLISPEAQYEKLQPKVWADGTVLALPRLPPEWHEKFEHVPDRKLAPKRVDIQAKALMEPAPEYMIRLFEDFRKEIVGG